jgi:hypothetical protein
MDNEITYDNGLQSKRAGNRLLWWRDRAHAAEGIFGPETIISSSLLPYDVQRITKAGKNPSDFCLASGHIVPKILIPEIEACITYAREQVAKKEAEKRAILNAAIISGEAFRVVEDAPAYGCELAWARWSRPGEGYYEYVMIGFAGGGRIVVNRSATRQVIGDRQSDGAFPGCFNQTWIVTAEEWDKIIELSADEEAKKAEAARKNEAEEAADIQHKIDTGYCFACESYCRGDCGHYSNDPQGMHTRKLKTALAEQNYGISEEA